MLDAMQLITALCALLAGVGAVGLLVLKLVAGRSPAAAEIGAVITDARAPLTFVVATASMLGSLYFSESADFVPCTFCWYQRIAMYPIAIVALVGMIRRDANARWYSLTLAAIGFCVSTYHYLIEWNPTWETGSCALFGPVCSVPWFRTFGFVSLALMALLGFAAIIAVNLVSFTPSPELELEEEAAA